MVYNAFNAYAGDIGELKEVGLFAGTWTALVQVVLTRLGARVLTIASFVSARGLLSIYPASWGLNPHIHTHWTHRPARADRPTGVSKITHAK